MTEGDEDEVVIDRLVIDLPEDGADEELGASIAREVLARFDNLTEEG